MQGELCWGYFVNLFYSLQSLFLQTGNSPSRKWFWTLTSSHFQKSFEICTKLVWMLVLGKLNANLLHVIYQVESVCKSKYFIFSELSGFRTMYCARITCSPSTWLLLLLAWPRPRKSSEAVAWQWCCIQYWTTWGPR